MQGRSGCSNWADAYVTAGQDAKSLELLHAPEAEDVCGKNGKANLQRKLDSLGAKHPKSQAILEFWGALYNELNRESAVF